VRALRKAAGSISDQVIIGERLKRLPSIIAKLSKQPNMKLSQMQDIGGCRAILRNMDDLQSLLESSRDVEEGLFSDVKKYDYIAEPKASGYRSVHFVWRYRSDSPAGKAYDGMRIEIQVRSALQHAWATAVEMASTYRSEDLKGSAGDDKWLRFFALIGSAIALTERSSIVPGTPHKKRELIRELKSLSEDLKVCSLMRRWSEITAIRDDHQAEPARLFLVTLRETEYRWFLDVRSFPGTKKMDVQEEYLNAEKENAGRGNVQVALLSVESIDMLRTAYPNYYGDTSAFITALEQILHGRLESPAFGYRP
jgi:Region found in RelA / SpoT proteins